MKKFYVILVSLMILFCIISCNKNNDKPVLYPIHTNGLYGFIDTLGNIVIEPQFLAVTNFMNDLAVAVIDTIYNNEIITKSWLTDSLINPKNSRFITIKYGYINYNGDFAIPPTFQLKLEVVDNKDGVSLSNRIIGRQELTKYIIDFAFSDIVSNLALFTDSISGNFGYIDKNGNISIEAEYKNASPFSEGKARVMKFFPEKATTNEILGIKWAFINTDGTLLTDYVFDDLTDFHQNRAFATFSSEFIDPEFGKIEGMYSVGNKALLNEKGQIIKTLPPDWYYAPFSKANIAVAQKLITSFSPNPDYKFIDLNGDFVLPASNITVEQIDKKMASGNYLGFLDENYRIPLLSFMQNGYAGILLVDNNNNDNDLLSEHKNWWTFIDENLMVRNSIFDDFYEDIRPFNQGLAAIKFNGKWGYVDSLFNIVIPLKYDSCEIARKYLCKVYSFIDNTNVSIESYVNRSGKIVWQNTTNLGPNNHDINNKYSQKDKTLYGQWFVNPYAKHQILINIGTIVFITILVILVFIVIVICKFKKT